MTEHKFCYSGGAKGSDLAWGDAAREHGYRVVHYSFSGHRTLAREEELLVLDEKQLQFSSKFCKAAAAKIERRWPPNNDYTRKLLQRNVWQVARSSAVYAVGQFTEENYLMGGTAWATQVFIDTHLPGPLPLWVFDQRKDHWKQWIGDSWSRITLPPKPPPIFAGIGTRELEENGAAAIKGVF